jgi:hypothetical protein
LQSSMPAPVSSRSRLTSAAEMFAITVLSRVGNRSARSRPRRPAPPRRCW